MSELTQSHPHRDGQPARWATRLCADELPSIAAAKNFGTGSASAEDEAIHENPLHRNISEMDGISTTTLALDLANTDDGRMPARKNKANEDVNEPTEQIAVEAAAWSAERSQSFKSSRQTQFDKRTKLIAKRFRLRYDNVQSRNLLWFAPPAAELQGVSLRLFHEWDPVRLFCADTLSKTSFQLIVTAVNIISCTLLSVRRADEVAFVEVDRVGRRVEQPYYSMRNVFFVSEYFAFLVLGLEVCMSVIARGLIYGHYAFVKDPFNVLDAVLLVVTFFELVLSALVQKYRFSVGWTVILRALRLLRLLKALMLFRAFTGCRSVVIAVWESTKMLSVVAFLFAVVLLSSSLGFVSVFGGMHRHRCVVEGTDTVRMFETFNDTSRVRPMQPERFCDISAMGATLEENVDNCPAGFVCDPAFGPPGLGFAHADNVLSSAFIGLHAVSGDGVDKDMWRTLRGKPGVASVGFLLLFLAGVVNLLLLLKEGAAILIVKYLELRAREKAASSEASVVPLGTTSEIAIDLPPSLDDSESPPPPPRWQLQLIRGTEVVAIVAILFQGVRIAARSESRNRDLTGAADSLERVILSSLFAVEMLIRALYRTTRRQQNLIGNDVTDSVLVLVDVAGIVGEALGAREWEVLRVVAGLRWYRIMELVPGARQILLTAAKESPRILSALTPMALLTVAAAITSRHLFRDNVDPSRGSGNSYRTMGSALAAVFQVGWGDRWNDLLYESVNAAAQTAGQMRLQLDGKALGYAAGVLLSLLWFAVRYCSRAVMVGVVIESFPIAKLEADFSDHVRRLLSDGMQQTHADHVVSRRIVSSVASVSGGIDQRLRRAIPWYDLRKPLRGSFMFMGLHPDALQALDSPVVIAGSAGQDIAPWQTLIRVMSGGTAGARSISTSPTGTSLWMPLLGGLPDDSRLRQMCYSLAEWKGTHWTVRGAMLGHWLVVAFGSDNQGLVVEGFYLLFSSVLVLDMLCKIVAKGLVAPREAVMRDPISMFDAVLTLINLLDCVPTLHSKVLRAVPCLRLLRICFPMSVQSGRARLGWRGAGGPGAGTVWGGGMKGLYATITEHTLWVVAVAVFIGMLFIVMALVGMEIFGGRLARCSCNSSGSGCVGLGLDGTLAPSVAFNGQFLTPCARWSAGWWKGGGRMDSFGQALLTVMQIATYKWGLALRPDPEHADDERNPVAPGVREIYIGWVVITSSILVEGLLSGMVVQRVMGWSQSRVTSKEEHLRVFERLLAIHRPRRPTVWPASAVSVWCRTLMRSTRYRAAVALSLVLNLVLLSTLSHNPSLAMRELFRVQDYFLFAVMVLETFVALVGFGWQNFRAVALHWLDVIAITASVGGFAGVDGLATVAICARMLRVVRLLPLLLRRSPALALIAEGLDESKTQTATCLGLLVCSIAAFAPLATAMFGTTRQGIKLGPEGDMSSVGWSFATLAQNIMGGDWQVLNRDLSVSGPHCTGGTDEMEGDCGSPWSPLVLLSLKLVCECVCLNLLLGSLVGGLQFAHKRRGGLGPYKRVGMEKQVRMLAEHWESVDPGGTGRLKVGLVGLLLWMLPKPLGFGKKSKRQELTESQRLKLVAITTELQLVAGLSDNLHFVTWQQRWWLNVKSRLRRLRRRLINAVCCCLPAPPQPSGGVRRRSSVATGSAFDRTASEQAEMGDRFWLENAGKLAPTYHKDKVDSVWLHAPLGDTVSFEQVGAAMMAWMVPDALSSERIVARKELTRLVAASVSAARIRTFVQHCMSAEQRREADAERRHRAWRQCTLSLLSVQLGTISSITAMGFGTWAPQGKQRAVVQEKMEAEHEREEVERLLGVCEEELQNPTPMTDLRGLRITTQSLQARMDRVDQRLAEQQRVREEHEAAEQSMRAAMVERVEEICHLGDEELDEGERIIERCERAGPLSSDLEIDRCLELVSAASDRLDKGEDKYSQAQRAGDFYGITAAVSAGQARIDSLRSRLETEEARMVEEDQRLRAPLSQLAGFTRIDNAEAFAHMHRHPEHRAMTRYFATVLLQAYARRKQDRIKYAVILRRRSMVGGRFVPLGQNRGGLTSLNPSTGISTASETSPQQREAGRARLKLLKATQMRALQKPRPAYLSTQ